MRVEGSARGIVISVLRILSQVSVACAVVDHTSPCIAHIAHSPGELFALCPYDPAGGSVEAVLDSSRYFVLRVESDDPQSGKKRKAFIGMGVSVRATNKATLVHSPVLTPFAQFEDRSDSFDFNVSLQDWVKRQRNAERGANNDAQQDDASGTAASSGPSPHLPKDGPKDLSLKDGQTFSIKLPGGGGGRKIRDGAGSSTGGGLGGFSLPPPPPGRRG